MEVPGLLNVQPRSAFDSDEMVWLVFNDGTQRFNWFITEVLDVEQEPSFSFDFTEFPSKDIDFAWIGFEYGVISSTDSLYWFNIFDGSWSTNYW